MSRARMGYPEHLDQLAPGGHGTAGNTGHDELRVDARLTICYKGRVLGVRTVNCLLPEEAVSAQKEVQETMLTGLWALWRSLVQDGVISLQQFVEITSQTPVRHEIWDAVEPDPMY